MSTKKSVANLLKLGIDKTVKIWEKAYKARPEGSEKEKLIKIFTDFQSQSGAVAGLMIWIKENLANPSKGSI